MIKDLTRKNTDTGKLTTKQVDKILQQKDIISMSNNIVKESNQKSYTSEKLNHSTDKIRPSTGFMANRVKSPSAKSKTNESYNSNSLENCKAY
jgi:hypothetical protein